MIRRHFLQLACGGVAGLFAPGGEAVEIEIGEPLTDEELLRANLLTTYSVLASQSKSNMLPFIQWLTAGYDVERYGYSKFVPSIGIPSMSIWPGREHVGLYVVFRTPMERDRWRWDRREFFAF